MAVKTIYFLSVGCPIATVIIPAHVTIAQFLVVCVISSIRPIVRSMLSNSNFVTVTVAVDGMRRNDRVVAAEWIRYVLVGLPIVVPLLAVNKETILVFAIVIEI